MTRVLTLLTVLAGGFAHGEDVAVPFIRFANTPGGDSVFRPIPGGLHVVTPATQDTAFSKLPFLWETRSLFALEGDFEMSATFDVAKLANDGKPRAEANVELAVLTTGDYRPVGINVNAHPDDGRCFRVIRFAPNRDGMHWNTLHFPRQFDRGRIVMRRRGAEMIFLAADGQDAALLELVRYPANPRQSPMPRITAFQGQQSEPMPIDVTLTDIVIHAEHVSREPDTAAEPKPLPAPESYPVTLDYGDAPVKLLADLTRGDAPFRAESGGVRIQLPQGEPNALNYFYRESRYALDGDFELTFRIDPVELGPPSRGGMRSANVGFGLEADTPIGSVTLSYGRVDDEPPSYTVTRSHPTSRGRNWDSQRIRAHGKPSRLAIRRTGAELTITAQEEGEASPSELVHFPYPPTETPRVRLWTFLGGPPPAPMDALVSEVVIKAGHVFDTDAPTVAIAPEDLGGRPRSRKWRYLAVAAVGVAGVGIAVVIGRWKMRAKSDRD